VPAAVLESPHRDSHLQASQWRYKYGYVCFSCIPEAVVFSVFAPHANQLGAQIFGCMEFASLENAARVSRSWKLISREEGIWQLQWTRLFGGLHEGVASWREEVRRNKRILDHFTQDGECLIWAIEQQFDALVQCIAMAHPKLVTHPIRRHGIPLYTASQFGHTCVLFPSPFLFSSPSIFVLKNKNKN
jgi:hypothetical protein